MNRYVVGVDGSGPSDAALTWTVNRAAVQPGSIVLVHVIDDEWGAAGSDYAREAMVAGQQVLQHAADRAAALSLPTGTPTVVHTATRITTTIVHGSPVWELAAACGLADLLVIGTHKTGFLRGRVLGSRSASIAAIAPCSVVIVPDSPSSSRHGVVSGVVASDTAHLGVAQAAREAGRLGESLLLVHSAPTPVSVPADDGVATRFARSHQQQLLCAAVQAATDAAPQVAISTRVSARHPAEALLDASRDATMLVLEPSRNRDQRSILGSTTHDVLMNINAPVLIARPRPEEPEAVATRAERPPSP